MNSAHRRSPHLQWSTARSSSARKSISGRLSAEHRRTLLPCYDRTMRIALAADHAGFNLKNLLKPLIERLGNEVIDLGAHSHDPDDDYPDFAAIAGRAVLNGDAERGVLLCG